MHGLPPFRLLRPADLDEAVAMAGDHPGARFVAGGTDLLVNMRRGLARPATLIDIGAVAELGEVSEAKGGHLRIGAGVTMAALIAAPPVAGAYPVLARAASQVAAATHREVATVGGNLCLDTRCVYYNQSQWWRAANDFCLKLDGTVCHVAPKGDTCYAPYAGDLAPACLVMDAAVEVAGPAGRRRLPLADLYREDGADHLTIAAGEVVAALILPPPLGLVADYRKVRVRGAVDFPLAGVAVALRRDGDTITCLRIALTGTNARPILLDGTDALLGRPLDEGALKLLASLAGKQMQPMRSTFAPAHYRRRAALNTMRRLLGDLYRGACR